MRFRYTKHDLAGDPRGAHVTLPYQGRTLLGTVTGADRDPVTGAIHLTVHHFNGDPWPLRPTALAVAVLDRTVPDA